MESQGFNLKIAGLVFGFHSKSDQIVLDSKGTVKFYTVPFSHITPDYFLQYHEMTDFDDSKLELVFSGEPQGNDLLNYKWKVYESSNSIFISVFFDDHECIKVITATLLSNSNCVSIGVCLNENCSQKVVIDPLIHPLGSLLLLYLMHWNNRLLIHASGVVFQNKAFLFTGVSGIGKSTMAKLWRDAGALVLNDDRLVIRPMQNEVILYNNPMPYYLQYPGKGTLQKIFLLKQSPQNYIKPLKGVVAYSRVLGNFIQQFYKPEMVKKHLEVIESVLSKVGVYEVGFKPDHEIVSMIKEMD